MCLYIKMHHSQKYSKSSKDGTELGLVMSDLCEQAHQELELESRQRRIDSGKPQLHPL